LVCEFAILTPQIGYAVDGVCRATGLKEMAQLAVSRSALPGSNIFRVLQ
jgi:hypothetical protein